MAARGSKAEVSSPDGKFSSGRNSGHERGKTDRQNGSCSGGNAEVCLPNRPLVNVTGSLGGGHAFVLCAFSGVGYRSGAGASLPPLC